MCEECSNVGTLEFSSTGLDYSHIVLLFSFTCNHQQSFLFADRWLHSSFESL